MRTITTDMELVDNAVFVCAMYAAEHVLRRPDLKRGALIVWLARVPVGMAVAMEAPSGVHH